jgi:hypothetical protein
MAHPRLLLVLAGAFAAGAASAGAEPSDAVAGRSASEPWGSVTVDAGQKRTGYLPVASGSDGETSLPITVVRGRRPGATVGIVAGVHGSEYVPIAALQRLAPTLDPSDVAGTIILVHLANPPSFYRRTVYYGPADWKNLNRVFPGKVDGTLSERIAHVITRDVIDRVDAFIDVHCGDANESARSLRRPGLLRYPHVAPQRRGARRVDRRVGGHRHSRATCRTPRGALTQDHRRRERPQVHPGKPSRRSIS